MNCLNILSIKWELLGINGVIFFMRLRDTQCKIRRANSNIIIHSCAEGIFFFFKAPTHRWVALLCVSV